MEPKDFAALGLGAIGTALGLFNAYKAQMKERVNLKLQLRWGAYAKEHTHGDKQFFCVDVVNLSSFPVTISEAVVVMHDGRKLFEPNFVREHVFPSRLESHESMHLQFNHGYHLTDDFKNAEVLQISTVCGYVIRQRHTFRRFQRDARENRITTTRLLVDPKTDESK